MSVKVKKNLKNILLVISFPIIVFFVSFLMEFLLKLGMIYGTMIRIIMSM